MATFSPVLTGGKSGLFYPSNSFLMMKSGCLQELRVHLPSLELQPGYLILGEPDVACFLILSLEAGRRKKGCTDQVKANTEHWVEVQPWSEWQTQKDTGFGLTLGWLVLLVSRAKGDHSGQSHAFL